MKRAPYTYGADQSGRKYWRSLDEFAETPAFKEAVEREFPDGASVLEDPVSRRSFMGLMGASLGLAGLAGCRRPEERILPYNKRPEDIVEGRPQFYATVFPFADTAMGLLVESHEGRPTKIEGNPTHPHSLGGASAFAQASILELYDPDRMRGPSLREGPAQPDWTEASSALRARAAIASKSAGHGLYVLTDTHRSRTLASQLGALQTKWPSARVFRYDPLSRQNERSGLELVFGQALQTSYLLKDAKAIVAIDSDLLLSEGSPVQQARHFAGNRRVSTPSATMNRLYVVESRFSITGASADHRLRLARKDIPGFVFALAKQLSTIPGVTLDVTGLPDAKLPEPAVRWVRELANDLGRHHGESLIAVGPAQPPVVHAVVAQINAALDNGGKTVSYTAPPADGADGPESLRALVEDMKSGKVETLLILGGNPVFDAPADVDFGGALPKVEFTAHLTQVANETTAASMWHLPQSHYLESWDDAVASDGTRAVIQPLIAPLFPSVTSAELIDLMIGNGRKGYEIVRAAWQQSFATGFEASWRKLLHDGCELPTPPSQVPALKPVSLVEAVRALPPEKPGIEVTFHPDSHTWDGRFANVGWMQEMPDQMTKETWGNAAQVSPATATKLGIGDGDVVEIAVGGKSIRIPAIVAPGQAEDSIAVTVGQGRTTGTVASGVGVNTAPIRTSGAFWYATGATVTKTGATAEIARTQTHHTMEGRPVVREASLEEYRSKPNFARDMVRFETINLFADEDTPKYDGLKWGMAIDLNACIGCNACMIACQAENNIPLVGKDGVVRQRSMHWIRVDRYYQGTDPDNPTAVVQPVGCQHCENAPCELVCPVAATEHSTEGLNDMAYNRCVGTRYCANNCPYKVRRFNFFNYNRDVPELRRMQFNPNVTVRSRGVMEKCTYCVQRIQEAKIAAKRDNRFVERKGEQIPEIKDGDVVSACAQTCPANAIKFGDLNDPLSDVAIFSGNSRAYGLLAEINTRPRTSFLARIRNPNPSLEKA
jgi:molybdopterin-containing oxidoreductase family iron-sulfur binding subunit